jgi:adenosylmethionine-8-amino-7-oxononanoate aminotransferase
MPGESGTRLWHPFADMAAVDGHELTLASADGCWVTDADGARYLDASASLWCCNLGHRVPEVNAAIAAQLDRLDSYSTFGDYDNEQASRLAHRLAALAPVDDARVFLTSGGGDSIDTAAKIARAHWQHAGRPQRLHVIGRAHGYHGTHGFGTSIGGIEVNTSGWGPLMPHVSSVPFDSLPALEAEIHRVGPDRVAAFFCEPVIGAGGVLLPPPGYVEGAAALCREHDVLFVVDAVICAFGRLGTWFGIERFDVRPDMIAFAKGVSGGILPLGGVVVSGRVAEPWFRAPGGPILRHGPTYSGHPACCAAANAALDLYERDGLVFRGQELEGDLAAALAPLADHPAVAEVRAGLGLMGAVQLSDELLAALPGAPGALQRAARDAGLLVRALPGGIAVSPPLTIAPDELRLIGTGIGQALDALVAVRHD